MLVPFLYPAFFKSHHSHRRVHLTHTCEIFCICLHLLCVSTFFVACFFKCHHSHRRVHLTHTRHLLYMWWLWQKPVFKIEKWFTLQMDATRSWAALPLLWTSTPSPSVPFFYAPDTPDTAPPPYLGTHPLTGVLRVCCPSYSSWSCPGLLPISEWSCVLRPMCLEVAYRVLSR